MRTFKLVLLSLALALVAAAQINVSRQGVFTVTTVANLPASPRTNSVWLVQDSADGTCTTGGGSEKVTCVYNGASYDAYGGGGAGGGAVDSVNGFTGTVVLDPDDLDDTATVNKFVTAGDLTTLGNTSGTNTGDQTLFNQTFEDEGTPQTQRSIVNCVGAGITCSDVAGETEINVPGGGGSADFLGDHSSPTVRSLSGGALDTALTVSGAYSIDTEADAAADDWDSLSVGCTAGTSGTFVAESDARTVNIIASVIQTPSASDIALDQDGDKIYWSCPTTDGFRIDVFVDEDGLQVPVLNGGFTPSVTTVRPAGTSRIQLSRHADDPTTLTDGLDGEVVRNETTGKSVVCDPTTGPCDSAAEWEFFSSPAGVVSFTISSPSTGVAGYLRVPTGYDGEITNALITSDVSCSAVVDVWLDAQANYPPTDADSITASAQPTLSSQTLVEDSTLTGWTTSFSAGDYFGFNVDSVSGCGWIVVDLEYTRQ